MVISTSIIKINMIKGLKLVEEPLIRALKTGLIDPNPNPSSNLSCLYLKQLLTIVRYSALEG